MPQPTSFDERLDDADRSYLYPHAWPPGAHVPHSSEPGVHVLHSSESGAQVPHSSRRSAMPLLGARAVIGNELRQPAVWCELGACIERFSHPDALGMQDIRARAGAVGWREDSFGRLACPRCQQADPDFRTTRPVVPLS